MVPVLDVLVAPKDGSVSVGMLVLPPTTDPVTSLGIRFLYPKRDAVTPPRVMLLPHPGMLVPPKEAAISLEMLVPHPGVAGVLSKKLLLPPWHTSPS